MRPARVLLVAVGVAAAAYGVLLTARLDLAELANAGIWLAAGVLVHDAVVAPLTVLAVLALRRVVPGAWRTPLTVGAVVLLTVTASAVPVLGRFGAKADNPTLLDRDYTGGWLLFAAVVLLGVVVWALTAARAPAGRPRRGTSRRPR